MNPPEQRFKLTFRMQTRTQLILSRKVVCRDLRRRSFGAGGLSGKGGAFGVVVQQERFGPTRTALIDAYKDGRWKLNTPAKYLSLSTNCFKLLSWGPKR